MRPSRRRLIKAALITTISAAILIVIAGSILSSILTKKVKAQLEASNLGIGSLSVNLFTRSITIEDLELTGRAKVKKVNAIGIRILPLLRERKISARKLTLENGSLSLEWDSTRNTDPPDSVDLKTILSIKSIDADRLSMDNIVVHMTCDSVTNYEGTLALTMYHITLDSPNLYRDLAAYKFRNVETTVRDLKINKKGGLSEVRIKYASFDKELMKLHIDSLELKPLLNKTDFAKAVKSQYTRTTLAVASIDATGVNMGIHMQDTSIMVSSITINGLRIHAYKNKKYPFTRKNKFPLPMETFRSLRIGIEVDSIKIHDGNITYEELPTEGFDYAWIKFEDVEATINAVSNREYKNMSDHATLEATAHVMKTGQVKATFTLPLGSKKRYSAEGTISNVPLRELNPLLKDLTFVEIATGKLNKMDFTFNYDDIGSQGQLRFDYENLKVLGLKKERGKDVNTVKTILLNTAVKNDETLTGNIDVIRDQKKAVFNLWARSLADGIRNALMPGKRDKKEKEK